jgi:acetate---CoA ligase (ADP-forming)
MEAALREVEQAVGGAGHRVDGWLLQEMARGGHEVIFGISTDPRFGPILVFGLGGKYVEVFQDVRFGVTLAPSPPPTRRGPRRWMPGSGWGEESNRGGDR